MRCIHVASQRTVCAVAHEQLHRFTEFRQSPSHHWRNVVNRIVMSVALSTGEDPTIHRAAQIAALALRSWTGSDPESGGSVQLLSARWEAEGESAGSSGRVSG
jgi:hypothetical protein